MNPKEILKSLGIPVLNSEMVNHATKFLEAYAKHDLDRANELWWMVRHELKRERLEAKL